MSELDSTLGEVDYYLASRLGNIKSRMSTAESDIDVLQAQCFHVRDYGAVLDGGTDDSGAFFAAVNEMNYGDTLIIDGPLRFSTPLVVKKGINLLCVGPSAYFRPDLAVTQDALTYQTWGYQQHVDWKVNVYGPANCCRNAVVIKGGWRSRYRLDVQAGAVEFGVKILATLISDFNINISDNYDSCFGTTDDYPKDGICLAKNIGGYTAWATSTPYVAGNSVKNSGVDYICILAHTSGATTEPGVGVDWQTYWVSLGGTSIYPAWATGTEYPRGEMVENGGAHYYSKSTHTSAAATEPGVGGSWTSYWQVLGAIAPNGNKLLVNIESGRHGIITGSIGAGEGNNEITGTIEGLSGRALDINACGGFHIHDIHMETNSSNSTITNCKSFNIGPGVINGTNATGILVLANCHTFTIDGYAGGLNIDAQCKHGRIINVFGSGDNIANSSDAIWSNGVHYDSGADNLTLQYTPGSPPLENIFHNPYCDIWDQGTSAAPAGWSGSNVTWAKNTGTVYGRNPINGPSIRFRTTASASSNGPVAQPLTRFNTLPNARWVSFHMPVLVPTGIHDMRVYVLNGASSVHTRQIVTEKDTWVDFRASVRASAAKGIRILPRFYDTASTMYRTGTAYIGGLSIVNGPIQPQYLCDHGRRKEYILNNVSHAPAFAGQIAIDVSGIHMAQGTSGSSDWKPLDH